MNSPSDLDRQQVLDEAIKLLYKSRPAKAAELLGLLEHNAEPISLAPEAPSEEKLGAFSTGPIPGAQGLGANSSPSGFNPLGSDIKYNMGDNNQAQSQLGVQTGVDISKGPKPLTSARSTPTQSIAQGPGIDAQTGIAKTSMSQEEAVYYSQMGLDPSTLDDSGAGLTPTQIAGLGAGGVGVAAANRARAKNVAARELKGIRQQYLQAVQEGALDKQRLRMLNQELKLRGARPSLSLAPSLGIADAQMARAEQSLSNNVLKNRYRGAMPLLAATLLGTLAYNKLNEG